jgi:formate hydrogenlyase subunit 4
MELDPSVLILSTLTLFVLSVAGGFFLLGVDRKLAALMQARVGPPLRQPWWDFLKLMRKENIVPNEAVEPVYNMMPILALASTATVLPYLSIAGLPPLLGGHGDLILVLYLLAVPALAMVIGGFASASPYATIGAQREMVTMMSYELPLGVIVMAFAWKMTQAGLAHPFSLATISANPVWGLVGPIGAIGLVLLLAALLLVTPAELAKMPFDAPEAKSELADGLLAEYSGRNLAFFNLALGVKMVVMMFLITTLFFPYRLTDLLCDGTSCSGTDLLINGAFDVLKVFVLTFVTVTLMRVSVARLRITQIVTFYWKYSGALTVTGLLLLMLDGVR